MTDREPEQRARPTESGLGEEAGWLTRLLLPVTRWFFTNVLAGPLVVLFFGVLTRTRIYGRRRVPREPNTLLLANHQSMIDSFPIGYAAFFPVNMFRTFLQPWNPAAQENFFRTPFLGWVFLQFKCIPVRPGRRDLKAITRSARAVRTSTLVLFPEGTRSRDGSVGRGRPGAGMVILETEPKVVPVTILGMDDVLPIGSRFPRFWRRVSIYFGKPIEYADLLGPEPSRELAQTIVDRVMDRVAFQARVIERVRGGHGVRPFAAKAAAESDPEADTAGESKPGHSVPIDAS